LRHENSDIEDILDPGVDLRIHAPEEDVPALLGRLVEAGHHDDEGAKEHPSEDAGPEH
jgi:hypothetical protein